MPSVTSYVWQSRHLPSLDVRVVASGGCASPVPASADLPTLDPEEACQQAIDARQP
ncbi:MAG TPA: hypothetical protein VFS23_03290 [Vicinamibacterales bacterium]|nr:hypothetical protein [Vicinamibacterales bacterium]